MLEQEAFWNAGYFAVITDGTKPAMNWTIDELNKRGKKVYVVDMSGTPDKGILRNISELPTAVDCAVIGVTKTNPADSIQSLEKKGIKKFWIHWRTETPEVSMNTSCTVKIPIIEHTNYINNFMQVIPV